MNSLLTAAVISFLAGLFGYIIARYWLRPIGLYRRHKRRLATDLSEYAAFLSRQGARGCEDPEAQLRLRSARQTFQDLLTVYEAELPRWYRLVLANRKESPAEATPPLMALIRIRHPEHAAKRLIEVRKALNIE
jgi:hypothetical protein